MIYQLCPQEYAQRSWMDFLFQNITDSVILSSVTHHGPEMEETQKSKNSRRGKVL